MSHHEPPVASSHESWIERYCQWYGEHFGAEHYAGPPAISCVSRYRLLHFIRDGVLLRSYTDGRKRKRDISDEDHLDNLANDREELSKALSDDEKFVLAMLMSDLVWQPEEHPDASLALNSIASRLHLANAIDRLVGSPASSSTVEQCVSELITVMWKKQCHLVLPRFREAWGLSPKVNPRGLSVSVIVAALVKLETIRRHRARARPAELPIGQPMPRSNHHHCRLGDARRNSPSANGTSSQSVLASTPQPRPTRAAAGPSQAIAASASQTVPAAASSQPGSPAAVNTPRATPASSSEKSRQHLPPPTATSSSTTADARAVPTPHSSRRSRIEIVVPTRPSAQVAPASNHRAVAMTSAPPKSPADDASPPAQSASNHRMMASSPDRGPRVTLIQWWTEMTVNGWIAKFAPSKPDIGDTDKRLVELVQELAGAHYGGQSNDAVFAMEAWRLRQKDDLSVSQTGRWLLGKSRKKRLSILLSDFEG